MPPLLNKSHEKFCHFIARGNDPVSAYVGAGYLRNPEAAALFLCQPTIIARVHELLPHYLERYPDEEGPKNVPALIERLVVARSHFNRAERKKLKNART